MPQLKQPQSLQEATLKRASSLILEACNRLQDKYGNTVYNCYHAHDFEPHLSDLRAYLLDNLGHKLDDIVNLLSTTITRYVYKNEKNVLLLFLDVCIHRNSRNVVAPFGYDKKFLNRHISKLSNVVHLDVYCVEMDDNMMITIGNCCTKLEVFKFHLDTWTMDKKLLNSLPKSTSCLALLQCPNLRIVVDLLKFESQSVKTIKKLVRGLPKLSYLNYPGIGEIISYMKGNVTNFSKLMIHGVQESCLQVLDQVCPNLRGIELHCCTKSNLLSTLADSSLKLMNVDLSGFPINSDCERFLNAKGKYLTDLALHFKGRDKIGLQELEIIGKQCTFLLSLNLATVSEYEQTCHHRQHRSGSQKKRRSASMLRYEGIPMFTRLEELRISMPLDFNQGLVQMCLNHATKIEKVCLFIANNKYTLKWDDVFREIAITNAMERLSCLTVAGSNMMMGLDCVCNLIDNCNSLCNFYAGVRMDFDAAAFEREFVATAAKDNLQLRLQLRNRYR